MKLSKTVQSAPHITSPTKKRQQVIVVGDSLLRVMEVPICQTDLLLREVCCLSGAHIRDVTRRLPSHVQPKDYYLPIMFHMGTTDASRSTLTSVKRDKPLGAAVKGLRSTGSFFQWVWLAWS